MTPSSSAAVADRHLERRPGRIAALDRAVLERLQVVGVERRPRRAIDAGGERVGVVGRHAGERQHLAGLRVHDHRRAVEPRRLEPVLERLLQVVVDRQRDALAFVRRVLLERPDFAPDAVDDDAPGAVLAHQQRVVDLFDPRLPDDVAALQAVAVGHLRVADFADVAEQCAANASDSVRVGTCSTTMSGSS